MTDVSLSSINAPWHSGSLQAALVSEDFGLQLRVPNVIIDARLLVQGPQFRFPRSHKKRIRKKWAKRSGNYRVEPDANIYEIGKGTFVCHPVLHAALREYLCRRGYVYYGAGSLALS